MFIAHSLLFQRFKPVAVPSNKHGQFHVGDAYIILKVSMDSQ
jgi:hypothetical protein